MKIVFDNTKELPIDNFFEHLIDNVLNSNNSIDTSKGEVIPDLTPFVNYRHFDTVQILDGVDEIPLAGNYNTVDVTVHYHSETKLYCVSITLSHEEI